MGHVLVSVGVAALLWLVVHNLDRLPATFRVPVTYEHPDDVVKLDGYPSDVEVRVLATKPKLQTLQASEFVVRVRNPEGRLGEDAVVLDAENVSAPFGVVVEQVNPARITVTYDRRVTRRVPVRVDVRGTPAADHEVIVEDIASDPPEIELIGPESHFEKGLVVRTEPVDVTGRTSMPPTLRLALVPPGLAFSLPEHAHVQATVRVRPKLGTVTFEQVPVDVVEGRWLTSHPNPRHLRVTVEGPATLVRGLAASAVRVALDATELEPRGEDYALEPTVTIDAEACPGCRVAALGQKRIHLHVKPSRRRASRDGGAPSGAAAAFARLAPAEAADS